MNRRALLPIVTVVYWLALLTATHLPPTRMPQTHVNDKVEHFVSYGLLTALLAATLWRTRLGAIPLVLTLLAIVYAYGAIDERTQPWFGRTCDLHDWLADATAATGVAIIAGVVRAMTRARLAR